MPKKRPWPSLLFAAVVAWAAPATATLPAASVGAPVGADLGRFVADPAHVPRPRAQSGSEGRAPSGARSADAARRNAGNRNRGASPAASGPRLRLDAAEPALSEEALAIERAIEVVARAAADTRRAASAAAEARIRINSLEKTVVELRSEAQGEREAAMQLRGQLSQRDAAGRWVWPLLALALLLAGIAAWLARRLAAVKREYRLQWEALGRPALPPAGAAPSARLPAAAAPRVGNAPRQLAADRPGVAPPQPAARPEAPQNDDPALPLTQPMTTPAAPRPFTPEAAMQRTDVLPPNARSAADDVPPPRDVSIEELIDLEQQAEFFIVLGQDESAIELLTEHLRHTGGGSPLPYLKLLEIFHRRGDRDDYERMRTRFNHRFNAYAPEWGSDLAAGRSLEDYAGILPRLQQAWPRPLDAMAEMEALLFRKSRGDLFDLPAYRELLFLYALARDLLDREGADTGTVDLLLPLSNAAERGGEFGNTAPAPYLGLESDGDGARGVDVDTGDDRPTLPLDFDLSDENQRQASIFDPPERLGRQARRQQ